MMFALPMILGTGSLLTGAGVYYATYAVRSQWLGPSDWHGRADTSAVALTFDDGPSADTERILDVLAAHNLSATFFMLGRQAELFPDIARRVIDEGHEVGNHSYSHPIYLFRGPSETRHQLERAQETITNVTGARPRFARPPCGVRTPAYFDAARQLGLRTVQWSVAGFDWKKLTGPEIADQVLRGAEPGSVILLHDGDSARKRDRSATVAALPMIIKGLQVRGLNVVPLSQLLEPESRRRFGKRSARRKFRQEETPVVFLDFDGTITRRDAVDAILEKFADPRWLAIEEDWKSGRIGSRECLSAQMQLVRATRDQIDALLDSIEVDDAFVRLLDTCSAHGVEVHIISDGFDYCINRILNRSSLNLHGRLKNVRILSSHIERDKNHWKVDFPSFHQSCAHGCATCKPAVMRLLNQTNAPAIFVGDGLSDRYAVESADLVFAKDGLASYCAENSIEHTPYQNLGDVAAHLDRWLAGRVFLREETAVEASA
jgi:2,3-diketo-5-methylthio-1-phosphopentane phosphatase